MSRREIAARRLATAGAAVTVAGILLSGPVSLGVLTMLHRSVEWRGPRVFAESFYRLQTAPYFFGLLLIVGYLMLFAGLQQSANDEARPRATVALMFTSMYGALVAFNYICQTTFIPAVVAHYGPEHDGIISALSMSSPFSLAWSIEMWGYALLGAATWFAAAMFREGRLNRWIGRLMILNGIASIGSALAASTNLSWLMTRAGMVAYVVWNVLALLISALILASLSGGAARAPASSPA